MVRAQDNADVRCIVVTGAGGIFCAGGDVNDQVSGNIRSDETDSEAARAAMVRTIRDGMEMSQLLYEMPKPTLAIISGAAAGAGLALALVNGRLQLFLKKSGLYSRDVNRVANHELDKFIEEIRDFLDQI